MFCHGCSNSQNQSGDPSKTTDILALSFTCVLRSSIMVVRSFRTPRNLLETVACFAPRVASLRLPTCRRGGSADVGCGALFFFLWTSKGLLLHPDLLARPPDAAIRRRCETLPNRWQRPNLIFGAVPGRGRAQRAGLRWSGTMFSLNSVSLCADLSARLLRPSYHSHRPRLPLLPQESSSSEA